MNNFKNIIKLILFFYFMLSNAFAINTIYIPEKLQDWKKWVLYDKENCPLQYNNENISHCIWPVELSLDLEDKKGLFVQNWIVYNDGFVQLPGSYGIWPLNVELNNKKAIVIDRDKKPYMYLEAGKHEIKGIFKYNSIPEILSIPSNTGLIDLKINNKKIHLLSYDQKGNLWLQKTNIKKYEKDKLFLNLYRLISDNIPLQVVCYLKLTISGSSREEMLHKIIPEDTYPVKIESPIPVRLLAKGDIMIQARPGQFDIKIIYNYKNPVEEIAPKSIVNGQEIWSFEAKNELRMVTIEGLNSIDPYKTDLPENWKKFPAYIINPGSKMIFKVERRGDPDPAPDKLNLNRSIWLDFSGKGMTINDEITGSINKNWRLTINPPTKPGRISIDSKDQLITNYGDNPNPGIEVRKGMVNISADMRYESDIGNIPAVSWDHNFNSLQTTLNLPPGWKLFTLSGVDSTSGTWIAKWSLLDFFLILIIFMIVLNLKNKLWAVIALITMILCFQEHESPRLVWISLLASSALLKILPDYKIKNSIKLWKLASMICLLIIAVPFMINQIKTGIFPQLEKNYNSSYSHIRNISKSQRLDQSFNKGNWRSEEKILKKQLIANLDFYGSQSQIQTGPGIPKWRWKKISLKFNGPVSKNHEIGLWLINPFQNFILNFIRVFLIITLIAGLFDLKIKKSANKI